MTTRYRPERAAVVLALSGALASLAALGLADAGAPGKGPPGAPAPPEEQDRPLWRASIAYSERSKSVYSRLDADYDISAGGAPRNGTVRFSSEHVYPGGKTWTGGGTVAFQSLDRLWQDVGPDGVLLADGGRLMSLGLPVVHLVVQGGRRLVSGVDDLAVEVRADYPEANEAVIMAGSIATPESEALREKRLEELQQAGEKQAGEVLRAFGFKSRPGSEEFEKEAERMPDAGRAGKALRDTQELFGRGLGRTLTELRKNVVRGSKTWSEAETTRTLSWTFTLEPPDVEVVVIPREDYERWMPEAAQNEQDEDVPGSTLSFSARLQKRGRPGVKPDSTASFVFELLGTSREKGTCLNAPPPGKARQGYDLRILASENRNLSTVARDGQRAESQRGLQASEVTVTSHDWGAWGRLRVTAKLDDGRETTGHWKGRPDRRELSIPLDENGNRIADEWEKDRGVFDQNLPASWDGAPNPGFQKADGDGISLYEKYRGFELETGHERLRPRQKYLFVHDPTEIVSLTQTDRASFDTGFSNVSQIEVLFIDGDQWTGPGSQLDGKRIVNFNHGFGHAVDQHALHVEKAPGGDTPEAWRKLKSKYLPQGSTEVPDDWGGVALLDHPFAYGSPKAVYQINVYVDVLFAALLQGFLRANEKRLADSLRACERRADRLRCVEQALDQVLGDLTARPEGAAEALMKMVTLTVSHELGHGVGVDHHQPITAGDRRCVMRYQAPRTECPASPDDPYFLKCYQPWPDRISRQEPERCWQSIKVTDRAR